MFIFANMDPKSLEVLNCNWIFEKNELDAKFLFAEIPQTYRQYFWGV